MKGSSRPGARDGDERNRLLHQHTQVRKAEKDKRLVRLKGKIRNIVNKMKDQESFCIMQELFSCNRKEFATLMYKSFSYYINAPLGMRTTQ